MKKILIITILLMATMILSAEDLEIDQIDSGYRVSTQFEVNDTDMPKPMASPVSLTFTLIVHDNDEVVVTMAMLYGGVKRDLGECRARVDDKIYKLDFSKKEPGVDNPLVFTVKDDVVAMLAQYNISDEMIEDLKSFDVFRVQYYKSPVSLKMGDNIKLSEIMSYSSYSYEQMNDLYNTQIDAKFGDL